MADTYNIILKNAGSNKLAVVKYIKELTGLGLAETKDLVDNCPQVIKEGVDSRTVRDVCQALIGLGATVSSREVSGAPSDKTVRPEAQAATVRPSSPTVKKKFICSICGYVHEGEEAPQFCPLCAARKEKFTEIRPEAPSDKTVRPDAQAATVRPDAQAATVRPDAQAATVRPEAQAATVRPGAQAATVRPGGDSKTVRPGADAKTVRPGGDVKTVRPASAGGPAASGKGGSVSNYDPTYTIKGVVYTVVSPLSRTSGEAQVFLVTDPKGKKFVLKLYYEGVKPNIKILKKVESVNSAGIFFKLYDHGDTDMRRYFELMEYYEGGSLDNLDVRKNADAITKYIASMAAAIDMCHHLGFLHRDIKPSNFVFAGKDRTKLLLGDFGIGVECDSDGKCVSDQARTMAFAAPEVYITTGDGKVNFSTKSDFYSLGVSILYLWMGKDDFNRFEKENELQLATIKNDGEVPIPASMPTRLHSLVKALLAPKPRERAGFNEVKAWLEGKDPFGGEGTGGKGDPKSNFRVVFSGEKGLVANSPKELADIMFDNADLAKSYLYKGRVTVWLEDNGRPELAVEMERIKEDVYPTNTTAGLEAACYYLNQSMPFVDIEGKKCSTSADIAKSILHNFEQYRKQIAGNRDCRLMVYLQTHRLGGLVADFRKEFASNQRLGLLYLAYRLDASQPWYVTEYEKPGTKALYNVDDVLNFYYDNVPSDQTDSDIVSQAFLLWVGNRDCRLIVYLQTHRLGGLVADFRKEFASNQRLGLLYLAYRLDASQPWYATEYEKPGTKALYNVDDVLDFYYDNVPSDQTDSDIVSQAFLLWVGNRDKMAAAAIQSVVKNSGNANYTHGVLYRLHPRVDYFCDTNPNDSNRFETIEDIGYMINGWLVSMILDEKDNYAAQNGIHDLFELQKGKPTKLYHFLQAKGEAYAKYIDWIKYCLELNSRENTRKAGPYNDAIAIFKIAKGMTGGTVAYEFKSGKMIYGLSELADVDAADLQDALNNKYDGLRAWIAVHFQEDPNLDKSQPYAYERATVDYVNYLRTHGMGNQETQRYYSAKQTVVERADKLRESIRSVKASRMWVWLIGIAPTVIAAIMLALMWRPGIEGPEFDTLFGPIAVICTIICLFADGFSGWIIGEIIAGCILSAIISGLIVWLSGYVIMALPFIFAIALLCIAVAFYHMISGSAVKDAIGGKDRLLDPSFEYTDVEPLHEAFHPRSNGFVSSIGKESKEAQAELDKITKSIRWKALPMGIVCLLGIIYFAFLAPGDNDYEYAYAEDSAEQVVHDWRNGVNGNWDGSADGQHLHMYFTGNSTDFAADVTLDDGTSLKLLGTYNPAAYTLTINGAEMSDKWGNLKNTKATGELYLYKDEINGKASIKKPNGGYIDLNNISMNHE